ncbi:Hypothetical protein UVM_LOCUS205 [uncultured virus]|nr:Hypothetical protein UVM_LOCUS205 [uncultured virus]
MLRFGLEPEVDLDRFSSIYQNWVREELQAAPVGIQRYLRHKWIADSCETMKKLAYLAAELQPLYQETLDLCYRPDNPRLPAYIAPPEPKRRRLRTCPPSASVT